MMFILMNLIKMNTKTINPSAHITKQDQLASDVHTCSYQKNKENDELEFD